MSDIHEEKKQQSSTIDIQSMLSDSAVDESQLTEMAKAGVFYGHKNARKNPKFDDYIYGSRNGVAVIDLVKTYKAIDIVAGFIKNALAEKKTILVVGIQPAARESIIKLSESFGNSLYVVNRWIGGLLTNFGVIGKRIDYFRKRKADLEQGRFEGYTKKEKLLISREVEKMEIMFTGLENMIKLPDIVFVIDGSSKGHKTAVHEARLQKMQVIGIIDNDDDPQEFNYFIPANDHTKASIELITNSLISKIQK
ncbi:MAG TPA: 30S ribosomal protein S2 [Candidatus Paceibacterota bacterium]|nr:30S ribosomal protein S2 [Candidatus Paceibacterota bacterium]